MAGKRKPGINFSTALHALGKEFHALLVGAGRTGAVDFMNWPASQLINVAVSPPKLTDSVRKQAEEGEYTAQQADILLDQITRFRNPATRHTACLATIRNACWVLGVAMPDQNLDAKTIQEMLTSISATALAAAATPDAKDMAPARAMMEIAAITKQVTDMPAIDGNVIPDAAAQMQIDDACAMAERSIWALKAIARRASDMEATTRLREAAAVTALEEGLEPAFGENARAAADAVAQAIDDPSSQIALGVELAVASRLARDPARFAALPEKPARRNVMAADWLQANAARLVSDFVTARPDNSETERVCGELAIQEKAAETALSKILNRLDGQLALDTGRFSVMRTARSQFQLMLAVHAAMENTGKQANQALVSKYLPLFVTGADAGSDYAAAALKMEIAERAEVARKDDPEALRGLDIASAQMTALEIARDADMRFVIERCFPAIGEMITLRLEEMETGIPVARLRKGERPACSVTTKPSPA